MTGCENYEEYVEATEKICAECIDKCQCYTCPVKRTVEYKTDYLNKDYKQVEKEINNKLDLFINKEYTARDFVHSYLEQYNMTMDSLSPTQKLETLIRIEKILTPELLNEMNVKKDQFVCEMIDSAMKEMS